MCPEYVIGEVVGVCGSALHGSDSHSHIIVTFKTLYTSDRFAIQEIQRLQKKYPATFSRIMATNAYLKGRQHAEIAESNCVHKQTEEKHANSKNPPHIHCKNTIPLAEFGTFLHVALHTAVLW